MGLTVFLPCRRGSERLRDKNRRPFGCLHNGLIELKLAQLQQAQRVDRVIVSTDDPWVYANADGNVHTHWRDPLLCQNSTSTDDLIPHAVELIPSGDILWTHCTSPFVTGAMYDAMIDAYYAASTNDSLMAVHRVHGFYWQDGKPLNYSGAADKWPRTQTLEPVFKVTSGAFIANADIYRQGDRIGRCPQLFEVSEVAALDVDTMQDFTLAEHLYVTGFAAV